MRHRAIGLTDVGRARDRNEDCFLVDEELGLYIVADGVGGNNAGEVASQLTCQTVQRVVRDHKSVVLEYAQKPTLARRRHVMKLLEEAVRAASRAVHRHAQADARLRGMAATVAAVLIEGRNALLASVGDSRAYLIRNGQGHLLSEDHSVAADQVRRGLITPDEALKSPLKTQLTRAIGLQPWVEVDLLQFELAYSDRLLLCSDGLSDYITGEEIGKLLALRPPNDAAKVLIDAANQRGGKDNITALLVGVETPPANVKHHPGRKTDLLRRVPMFRSLSYRHLLKLLAITHARAAEKNERVLAPGTPGEGLYVVAHGNLDVRRKGDVISQLKAGSYFAELDLHQPCLRSVEVVATSPCRLLMMPRDAFQTLLQLDPALASAVLQGFAHDASDRLRRRGGETVDLRVKHAKPPASKPKNDDLSQLARELHRSA